MSLVARETTDVRSMKAFEEYNNRVDLRSGGPAPGDTLQSCVHCLETTIYCSIIESIVLAIIFWQGF